MAQGRDTEGEARLKALRDAVQVGIDDLEAGRFRMFRTADELSRYMRDQTDKAIEEALARRARRHP